MRRTAAFDLVNFANRFCSLLPERNNAGWPRVRLVDMRQGNLRVGQQRLGVGFVGSGFNARFHMHAFQTVAFRGVREADVLGVWSPNREHSASAAALARSLDIGEAKPFASIGDLVADPAIDALWLTGPNHSRVANVEEIVHALESGRGTLRGIACEKFSPSFSFHSLVATDAW